MASQQIELPRLVDATDDRRPDIEKIIAQASFSVNLASPTPPQSRKRVTSPRMNKKLQKLQQKSSELRAVEVGHDKEIRDASAVVRDIENGMKIREAKSPVSSYSKAIETLAILKVHDHISKRVEKKLNKFKIIDEIPVFVNATEENALLQLEDRHNTLISAWKVRYFVELCRRKQARLDCDCLREQLCDFSSSSEMYRTQISNLESQISMRDVEIESLVSRLTSANLRHDASSDKLEALQRELKGHLYTIERCKLEEREAIKKCTVLQNEVDIVTQNCLDHIGTVTELQQRLAILSESNSKFEADCVNLRAEVSKLQQILLDVGVYHDNYSKLTAEVLDLRTRVKLREPVPGLGVATTDSERELFSKTLTELSLNIALKDEKIEELSRSLNESISSSSHWTSELELVRGQCEVWQSKLRDNERYIKQFFSQEERMRQDRELASMHSEESRSRVLECRAFVGSCSAYITYLESLLFDARRAEITFTQIESPMRNESFSPHNARTEGEDSTESSRRHYLLRPFLDPHLNRVDPPPVEAETDDTNQLDLTSRLFKIINRLEERLKQADRDSSTIRGEEAVDHVVAGEISINRQRGLSQYQSALENERLDLLGRIEGCNDELFLIHKQLNALKEDIRNGRIKKELLQKDFESFRSRSHSSLGRDNLNERDGNMLVVALKQADSELQVKLTYATDLVATLTSRRELLQNLSTRAAGIDSAITRLNSQEVGQQPWDSSEHSFVSAFSTRREDSAIDGDGVGDARLELPQQNLHLFDSLNQSTDHGTLLTPDDADHESGVYMTLHRRTTLRNKEPKYQSIDMLLKHLTDEHGVHPSMNSFVEDQVVWSQIDSSLLNAICARTAVEVLWPMAMKKCTCVPHFIAKRQSSFRQLVDWISEFYDLCGYVPSRQQKVESSVFQSLSSKFLSNQRELFALIDDISGTLTLIELKTKEYRGTVALLNRNANKSFDSFHSVLQVNSMSMNDIVVELSKIDEIDPMQIDYDAPLTDFMCSLDLSFNKLSTDERLDAVMDVDAASDVSVSDALLINDQSDLSLDMSMSVDFAAERDSSMPQDPIAMDVTGDTVITAELVNVVKQLSEIVNDPAEIVNEPAEIVNEPAEIVNEPAQIVNEPSEIVNEPAHSDTENNHELMVGKILIQNLEIDSCDPADSAFAYDPKPHAMAEFDNYLSVRVDSNEDKERGFDQEQAQSRSFANTEFSQLFAGLEVLPIDNIANDQESVDKKLQAAIASLESCKSELAAMEVDLRQAQDDADSGREHLDAVVGSLQAWKNLVESRRRASHTGRRSVLVSKSTVESDNVVLEGLLRDVSEVQQELNECLQLVSSKNLDVENKRMALLALEQEVVILQAELDAFQLEELRKREETSRQLLENDLRSSESSLGGREHLKTPRNKLAADDLKVLLLSDIGKHEADIIRLQEFINDTQLLLSTFRAESSDKKKRLGIWTKEFSERSGRSPKLSDKNKDPIVSEMFLVRDELKVKIADLTQKISSAKQLIEKSSSLISKKRAKLSRISSQGTAPDLPSDSTSGVAQTPEISPDIQFRQLVCVHPGYETFSLELLSFLPIADVVSMCDELNLTIPNKAAVLKLWHKVAQSSPSERHAFGMQAVNSFASPSQSSSNSGSGLHSFAETMISAIVGGAITAYTDEANRAPPTATSIQGSSPSSSRHQSATPISRRDYTDMLDVVQSDTLSASQKLTQLQEFLNHIRSELVIAKAARSANKSIVSSWVTSFKKQHGRNPKQSDKQFAEEAVARSVEAYEAAKMTMSKLVKRETQALKLIAEAEALLEQRVTRLKSLKDVEGELSSV